MSGHSKWKTIKRVKGLADAKRGALFSRISKDIIIAVQLGGSGDTKFNPYLRVPIEKAKASNMPSEKVEKAINKGLGKSDGESILEKTYEVNGFGGVILLIDCETENSNRTNGEIKNIVNKSGAKMVPEGSLSWGFNELGRIVINKIDNIDETILSIISVEGVVDVLNEDGEITIYTKKELLKFVLDSVKSSIGGFEFIEAGLIKEAQDKVEISEDICSKNDDLIDKIKSHPDVVYVWDNIK